MPKLAFSYERVSRPQQAATGRGLERQGASALTWCRANGYTLDTELVLTDPGRSAYKGLHIQKGALGQFLRMAQSGLLGDSPVLVVEAIDRLSRQEPLDALETILQGLVGSGVRIVTLEDGNEYSRETLRTDPTRLIVLVVKVQSAHEYSARLSMRMKASAQQQRKLAAEGKNRAKTRRPFWIDFDAKTDAFVVNEKAATILRLYELIEDGMGMALAARTLNAEGLKPAQAAFWTRSNVQTLLRSESPVGTAIFQRDSKAPLRVANYFPAIVEPERRERLVRLMQSRNSDTSMRGRRAQTRWIGQGLTYCVCGCLAAMTTATKTTGIKGKTTHYYVRCKASTYAPERGERCPQKGLKLRPLMEHVLTRLSLEQLQTLFEKDASNASELRKTLAAKDALEGKLAEALGNADRATTAVKEAAKAGTELSLLVLLNDAAQETQQRIGELETALEEVQAKLDVLQRRPTALTASGLLSPLVDGLLKAFASEEETAEQRLALNNLLRRLQIRIHVDATQSLCGLQLRDGEIDWQPVDAGTASYALKHGSKAIGGIYGSIDDPELVQAIGTGNSIAMRVDENGDLIGVIVDASGNVVKQIPLMKSAGLQPRQTPSGSGQG